MTDPIIWVFTDYKVGSNMQALTLASKLRLPYQVKRLKYNAFTFLPSYIISQCPINIDSKVLRDLKNSPKPDIIISCGRRRAALALYMKKYFANHPKIVNLFDLPYMPYDHLQSIDLFILSHHDECRYQLDNSMRILGNVNNVWERIQNGLEDYKRHYSHLKKFIAVNIGGQTKNVLWCTKCRFSVESAKNLSDTLERLSQNHKLPLFISFSRRTPKKIKSYMRSRFQGQHVCYDPVSDDNNPYPAFMHDAEFVITTSDSTSMCSEIASTGKPNYVFYRENCNKKKCDLLLNQLIEAGKARKLEMNTERLEVFEYEPLSEIDRVVEKVKRELIESHV